MNKALFIAVYGKNNKSEEYSLIKIENYQAYEYHNKKWQEAPGLYSMVHDPGPWAEFIDEQGANEIMKIIDQFD